MPTVAELIAEVEVRQKGTKQARQDMERLQGTTRRYGRTASEATARAGRAWRQMGDRIRRVSRRAQRSIQGVIERMGGMRNVMLAGAAATAAGVAATFRFVDSQTQALDAINKTALAVGTGAEEYQRLRFAASQSGVETETLDRALRNINKNMLDMATGAGVRSKEALDRLGVSLSDLEGQGRVNQIGMIGDALNNVQDEGERAALAARIFGERSGPLMATLLSEGTAGIQKLAAQTGDVFSQDKLNKATAFQDRLGELRSELRGLGGDIAVDLLPGFENAVIGMRDWIGENDVFIKQGVGAVIQGIGDVTRETGETISAVTDITRVFTGALDDLGAAAGVDGAAGKLLDAASFAFEMIDPFSRAAQAIQDVRDGLVAMGIVSAELEGGTGAAFADRMQAALAKHEARVRASLPAPRGTPLDPNAGQGPLIAPSQRPRGPRRRGGGGGGRRAARPPSRPSDKTSRKTDTTSGLTFQEAMDALSAGNPEVLQERISSMAAGTPEARDIKPTVAMTVTITNNDVDVEQNITAPDAAAAGREVAGSIERLFRQAGLTLGNQVVR